MSLKVNDRCYAIKVKEEGIQGTKIRVILIAEKGWDLEPNIVQ